MAKFEKAQQMVSISEGRYQNDPQDSGNYYMGHLIGTNWGISAPTLAAYLGRIPSKEEMQNLSRKTAYAILKRSYWERNHLGQLKNQSVATLIYDGVVNQGTNAMRFLLEKVLRIIGRPLAYYEVFTPKGIQHLNSASAKKLFYSVKQARIEKYKRSQQKQYIKSWINRIERIKFYPSNSISALWPYAALTLAGIGIIIIGSQ